MTTTTTVTKRKLDEAMSFIQTISYDDEIMIKDKKFMTRLATFKECTWTDFPSELDPPIIASYGWMNQGGINSLYCELCKASFTPGTVSSNTDSVIEVFCSRLKTSHEPQCRWRKHNLTDPKESSNASVYKFPSLSVLQAENIFKTKYKELADVWKDGNKNITVKGLESLNTNDHLEELCKSLSILISQDSNVIHEGTKYTNNNISNRDDDHSTFKINKDILTLVLFGWQLSKDKYNCFECKLCQRVLGLWNFDPSTKNKRFIALKNEDDSDQGQTQSSTILNSKTEHFRYCPWISSQPHLHHQTGHAYYIVWLLKAANAKENRKLLLQGVKKEDSSLEIVDKVEQAMKLVQKMLS